MIKQPERDSRNVNDFFYESEAKMINMDDISIKQFLVIC